MFVSKSVTLILWKFENGLDFASKDVNIPADVIENLNHIKMLDPLGQAW